MWWRCWGFSHHHPSYVIAQLYAMHSGSCHISNWREREIISYGFTVHQKYRVLFYCTVQSLSGHTSAVESVTFDSAEALVVAGAASGTIKLWDLEEAKSKINLPCFGLTHHYYTLDLESLWTRVCQISWFLPCRDCNLLARRLSFRLPWWCCCLWMTVTWISDTVCWGEQLFAPSQVIAQIVFLLTTIPLESSLHLDHLIRILKSGTLEERDASTHTRGTLVASMLSNSVLMVAGSFRAVRTT